MRLENYLTENQIEKEIQKLSDKIQVYYTALDSNKKLSSTELKKLGDLEHEFEERSNFGTMRRGKRNWK